MTKGTAAQVLRGALAAKGMTHAQLAERLGTSRPRVTSYVSGATSPSADLFLAALEQMGAMQVRPATQSADSTMARINQEEALGEKARWLLEGRDHLRTASPLEAFQKWGSLTTRAQDPRWLTFLAALVRPEFERMNMEPPVWTDLPPLPEPWEPNDFPADPDSFDERMLEWNICIPRRDLVTL